MSSHDIEFDYPQAAYLLTFIFIFNLLYIFLFRYRSQALRSYTSSQVLSRLLLPRSQLFTSLKVLTLNVAWIGACLALTSPKGNLRYLATPATSIKKNQSISIPTRHRTHDVFFLVDASASMSVPDARQGQTRLQAAKEIVEEIVSQLRGENVALDAFTSELTPLVPLTLDYLFLRLELERMGINEGDVEGTNFSRILASFKETAFSNPSPSKLYTIILLSDGGDNQLEPLQGTARTHAIQRIVNSFSYPSNLNVRLFTIGVGSKEGEKIPNITFEGKTVQSKLQEDILEQLAIKNQGIYYSANDWPTWNLAHDLTTQMEQNALDQSKTQECSAITAARQVIPAKQEEMIYDFYYQIPLGLGILFLLIYFLLPDVHRL